jgi:hypothetical protein
MTAPRPAEGPDREAHTLAACPGGGCQAGHVNDVGEPVDAESAAILRLTKTSSGFWVCEHDRYWRHCPERGCIYVRDDLLPTPPAPAEGPDREALRDFLRLSMSEANVQHALALLPTPPAPADYDHPGTDWEKTTAAFPTPPAPGDHNPDECARHRVCYSPAPGDGEGLRAEVEGLCAEVDGWHVYESRDTGDVFLADAVREFVADLRAALAARDTDQGARDATDDEAARAGRAAAVQYREALAALARATPEAGEGT